MAVEGVVGDQTLGRAGHGVERLEGRTEAHRQQDQHSETDFAHR